jgi:hypothetical protein
MESLLSRHCSPLLVLHRDALACIFDFLPLVDIAALLCSCPRWPARDSELVNNHRRNRSRSVVRSWKPDHPLWDCRTPLRHLVTAVDLVIAVPTLPSALAQLRLTFPYLRELYLVFSMVRPPRLEWLLPLRLEVLDVEWHVDDVTQAVIGITSSLPHLFCLTSLRLISYSPFSFSECNLLLDAIRVHQSITQLELRPFNTAMLLHLTRIPHSMHLHRLALPHTLSIGDACSVALAHIPSLKALQSANFIDLSCLSSLRALTELRIRFVPDSEDDSFWDEQSDADAQSSLFLEHLPKLAGLKRLTMQLPSRMNWLRKSFVGEILFHAIHRSNFHLVELDVCDWLLKFPLLAALLRLPGLSALQTFRHRFTAEYREDEDRCFEQIFGQRDVTIESMQADPLFLPHLTELQLWHPWLTEAEVSALLIGMSSLTDLRLDCPRIGIGCIADNCRHTQSLRILHLNRWQFQDVDLQQLFRPHQVNEPD